MPGIFGDEGERGMDARAIIEGRPALIFGYGWWGVPNLYFYLVAWMLRLFGDTMVGDRMLSVISGVAGRLVRLPHRAAAVGAARRADRRGAAGRVAAGAAIQPPGRRKHAHRRAVGGGLLLPVPRPAPPPPAATGCWPGIALGLQPLFLRRGQADHPAAGRWSASIAWCAGISTSSSATLLGFVLLGLAFGLVFLPYALFSIKRPLAGLHRPGAGDLDLLAAEHAPGVRQVRHPLRPGAGRANRWCRTC